MGTRHINAAPYEICAPYCAEVSIWRLQTVGVLILYGLIIYLMRFQKRIVALFFPKTRQLNSATVGNMRSVLSERVDSALPDSRQFSYMWILRPPDGFPEEDRNPLAKAMQINAAP